MLHCNSNLKTLLQVDKLAETKGMDYLDREKAKRHAKQEAENLYDQNYGKLGSWQCANSQLPVIGQRGLLCNSTAGLSCF